MINRGRAKNENNWMEEIMPHTVIPMIISIILMLSICFADMGLCFKRIWETLPYPRHMDESYITERALEILKTGDWNPHGFNYSSFPVYMVAGALSFAYLGYAGKGQLHTIEEIDSVSYPYYYPARILFPARLLFAFFMVMAFAAMGITAWRYYGRHEFLFLTPLLCSFSMILLQHSWRYINVDTLATCMAALTLTVIAMHSGASGFWLTSILPGVLCGFTIAGKYTYFWIFVPALLAIWLYAKPWRFYRSIVLILSGVAAFICVVPYSILDVSTFLNELGALAYSYGYGREGRTYDPGWDHAKQYLFYMLKDYGPFASVLFLFGLGYTMLKNWRGTIILGSFPLLLLIQVSFSRLYYERNVIFAYVYYGFLLGAGLLAISNIIYYVFGKWGHFEKYTGFRIVITLFVTAAIAFIGLPFQRPYQMLLARPDTRNLALEWIKEHVPKHACILMPPELGFFTLPLKENDYHVLVRDYDLLMPECPVSDDKAPENIFIFLPEWGYYDAITKEAAKRKNDWQAKVPRLITYKGNPVGSHAGYPNFYGDPSFSIGRWEGMIINHF